MTFCYKITVKGIPIVANFFLSGMASGALLLDVTSATAFGQEFFGLVKKQVVNYLVNTGFFSRVGDDSDSVQRLISGVRVI